MSAALTTVRRGTLVDEAAVLALADQLAAFPVPSWRTAREIQRADDGVLRAALGGADAGAVVFVAPGTAGIDGVVCLTSQVDYFTHEVVPHIEVLAVDPAAQGRGVARALMQAAESWARERGSAHLSLNVWVQNARARGLYEHLGYHPETMHYLKDLQRMDETSPPAVIEPAASPPATMEQISAIELADLRRRAEKYRFLFKTIVTVTGMLVVATLIVVLAAIFTDM